MKFKNETLTFILSSINKPMMAKLITVELSTIIFISKLILYIRCPFNVQCASLGWLAHNR